MAPRAGAVARAFRPFTLTLDLLGRPSDVDAGQFHPNSLLIAKDLWCELFDATQGDLLSIAQADLEELLADLAGEWAHLDSRSVEARSRAVAAFTKRVVLALRQIADAWDRCEPKADWVRELLSNAGRESGDQPPASAVSLAAEAPDAAGGPGGAAAVPVDAEPSKDTAISDRTGDEPSRASSSSAAAVAAVPARPARKRARRHAPPDVTIPYLEMMEHADSWPAPN